MTRKEQNKILDAKIESNVNQYKVDRLNAEISAFSSGDLNKYEFLKRIDLNYKPNALDNARFEFSPLGKTFSTGLDKTAQCYQEEGVIKFSKDIRDGLAGGIAPRGPGLDDHNNDDPNNDGPNNDDYDDDDYIPYHNDDNNDDDRPDYNNMLDLETEEEDNYDVITLDLETKPKDSKLSNEEKDKIYKMLNKFKDNMKKDINNFIKRSNDYLDILDNKISKISNKLFKIKDTIKNNKGLTNAEKNEFQNKINELQNNINELTRQRDSVNNEHHRAVDKILKEQKKYENFGEKIKYDFNSFDEDGIHKDTGKHYDLNDFNSYGINVKTNDKYNPEGFDIKGFYKDTG